MSVRQHVLAALLGALGLGLFPCVSFAQDIAGSVLKAEYIFRLPPFVTWPPDVLPEGGPVTLCVVGDTAVRDALERTARDAMIGKRKVVVAFAPRERPAAQCHLLYVSGLPAAQVARLISGLNNAPVLTIGDIDNFNKMGGMIEFFYQPGRLLFSIRVEAAKAAGLLINSRLIELARPTR